MWMQTRLGMAVLLPAVAAVAAEAGGRVLTVADGDLAVRLGGKAGPVEARAAALLSAQVRERAGITLRVGAADAAGARWTLVVGTPESGPEAARLWAGRPVAERPGPDGFLLVTEPDPEGRLYVIGQSPAGVVAGVGKLLRLCRYAPGRVSVPVVTLADTPRLPVRGIYLATHFHNFYHAAPVEAVDAVIEEFALWGGNSLTVWFDMHHFSGLGEPAAQTQLARLRHFGDTARGVGMRFGLAFLANEAYSSSPAPLRAKWLQDWPHYHVEVCPATAEGLALIGTWQAELLAAFPAVDFIWTWPYDQGGCACDACKPWGANGFVKASEQLARLYRERFPGGQVWLSTWLFDSLAGGGGEYDGLFRYLREQRPEWLTGILTGTHRDVIPHQLLTRPAPERYPLTCFPEISMYRMNPWGGTGANPLPGFCTRLAADLRGQVQGGWPYSEGIYEDLNKFFWCRFFWNPDEPTAAILTDYAGHYLAPEATADALALFERLEATHERNQWRVTSLAGAPEAWALAQAIDGRLPGWARTSWRWRLLYARAGIDGVLATQGAGNPEGRAALKVWCDEITALYHADPQQTFIRPPDLPQSPPPGNLAFGRPVTVSSTNPSYAGRETAVVDGVYAQDDGENFWVHDVAREATAWLVIDLGRPLAVREVRLQFRGIHGVFWFVPRTVGLSLSADGVAFGPATVSEHVPKEGAPYAPDLWAYPLTGEGRYLRLELGPSQHTTAPYAGTLELVEVEVYGR